MNIRTGPRSKNAGGRRFSSVLAEVWPNLDDLDADVPEFYRRSRGIGLQTDVAEWQPLRQRTLLGVAIQGVIQVHGENLGAVPDRGNFALEDGYFHLVPFAVRSGHAPGGGHRPLQRTPVVPPCPPSRRPQDLQLHPTDGPIA